jgi:hypothetical protein
MSCHRMNYALILLPALIFIAGGSTLLSAQVTQQWVARYNGTGNYIDEAYSVAVDEAGNVVVTGMSTGVGTSQDYVTVKYDNSGALLWTARYNGPANLGDKAVQVVVDTDGNVYVTGYSSGSGTNYDYATVKYSSAGVQLWVARYNGSAYANDYAVSLAVDGDGNVYVTGQAIGSSLNADYYTIKYNSAGDQLWWAIYNGLGYGGDYPYALALDDSGNVYVTGQSQGSGSNVYDYATVKYSASGIPLWVARYDGPGNAEDDAYALAVDDNGNVFVTGQSYDVNMDYATVKYDAAGNQLWVARYNGMGLGADVARSIALGIDGSVSVTGASVGVGTGEDYATIKYDGAGNQLWAARYNGPGNGTDHAYAVGMDAGGNVYVTGESIPFGTTVAFNYATLRYDAFGNQLWVQHYNGPANTTDNAYSLAVDGSSNVYVTGRSFGSVGSYDYATIKYNQTPSFTVDLAPLAPPIVIPPNGGGFNFNATLANLADSAQSTQVWIMAQLPNLIWYGPVLGPLGLTLPGPGSITRQRSQSIPGLAPAGLYTYRGYLGTFAATKTDSSSFTFTKLGVGELEVGAWTNGGERPQAALIPSGLTLTTAPNPFNSATVLSYELQAPSYVSLKVYDTAGRLVATLADGWRGAGEHQVTFDGSGLASGVYIYRLEAGEYMAGGKLVLLK